MLRESRGAGAGSGPTSRRGFPAPVGDRPRALTRRPAVGLSPSSCRLSPFVPAPRGGDGAPEDPARCGVFISLSSRCNVRRS